MSAVQLQSMEITNFKSFYGTHIFKLDRGPGLFYMTGKNKVAPQLGANGCGKTGIWDALTWAITGKTGRDSRPAGAVVPWELDKGTCSIALKFKRNHQVQILERTRRPNNLTLSTPKLNQIRTITQEEVENILGISEEMFRRTVVLGQFGSLFLDLAPEQQARMFNDALNLDVWLRASQQASEKKKAYSESFDKLKLSLSKLEGNRETLLGLLRENKQASKTWDEQHAETLSTLTAKLNELKVKANTGAPGQGKASGGGKGSLEAQIEASKARQRALNRQFTEAAAQARSLGLQQIQTEKRISQYDEALAGEQRCPECGQETPKAHLKDKKREAIEELDTLKKDEDGAFKERKQIEEQYNNELKTMQALEDVLHEEHMRQSEILAAKNVVTRHEQQTNPHDENIVSIRKKLAESKGAEEEANEKLVKLEKALEICSYWTDSFKEIRISLIDQILGELEMATTRHAERLGLEGWRVEFKTERVSQAGTVSTAFTILLYPPDLKEPVKFESYSGGESQRWQLAVAFGLSEVILERAGVSPNIEVYDEPTRGLSPEGVSELLEHLSTRAYELGRTIYVVEHHSLERGMFKDTIVVEMTEQGSNIKEK